MQSKILPKHSTEHIQGNNILHPKCSFEYTSPSKCLARVDQTPACVLTSLLCPHDSPLLCRCFFDGTVDGFPLLSFDAQTTKGSDQTMDCESRLTSYFYSLGTHCVHATVCMLLCLVSLVLLPVLFSSFDVLSCGFFSL